MTELHFSGENTLEVRKKLRSTAQLLAHLTAALVRRGLE
jgi:hypothetical protein